MDGFVVGLVVGINDDKFTVNRNETLLPFVAMLDMLIPVLITPIPKAYESLFG